MPKVTTIEAGTTDFSLFSEEANKTTWRQDLVGVAPMFRPTLALTSKLNAPKTNANVALKLSKPVIVTVNGLPVVRGTRISEFRHTALQNLDSAEAISDIDVMIAALTALKQNIVDGRATA